MLLVISLLLQIVHAMLVMCNQDPQKNSFYNKANMTADETKILREKIHKYSHILRVEHRNGLH